MTVIEAMKYLELNPSEKVISENEVVCDLDFFKKTECWSKVGVFGKWKVKREPRVRYMNEYPCGFGDQSFVSKEEADRSKASFRVACVKFIEVIE